MGGARDSARVGAHVDARDGAVVLDDDDDGDGHCDAYDSDDSDVRVDNEYEVVEAY